MNQKPGTDHVLSDGERENRGLSLFSWSRWVGIIVKEFIQLKRDRLTFGMIIGIPVIQLILFGYAINADPKRLPTAVLSADSSPYSRTLLSAMQTSGYFRITNNARDEDEIDDLLAKGRVTFAVTIPENFGRKLVRGERPVLLVEADASDPSAVGNAVAALTQVVNSLSRDLSGPLAEMKPIAAPVDVRVHRRYNPEAITAYNIVPGLIGTILTMTMVLMTGLAMTRERERGTFENLLSTPALPIEVMTGKIVPYIMIGLIQVSLIIACALVLFQVPMQGNPLLLYFVVLIFIAANLALGITFSSIARNQLQAMQMTFFFFLPSMLLSGFMFPFRGMPEWAQWIGSLLPLTHFLVLVRGIMLKGNGFVDLIPQIWPILAFMVLVILVGLGFYKRTLD
jgi:ABC-2 type transport system permease protein